MGEAAAKEPTMEDILSSIRKIIAEEGEPEAGEAEVASDGPAPALDAPVEISKPDDAPLEESQPNLQQIVDKVASAGEAVAGLSERKEPAAPEPAPADPTPVAPAAPQKAASLADIAASVKAQEISETSTQQAAPAAVKAEPAPPTPAATAPEPAPTVAAPKPVEAKAAEMAAAKDPAPELRETKIEMADAEPAPVRPAASAETAASAGGDNLDSENKAEIEASAFKGALMSPSSNNLVSDSFERLKRSVMDDLDAKTEAILRPMLREWLDENLPTMVERMVREEIERVARG